MTREEANLFLDRLKSGSQEWDMGETSITQALQATGDLEKMIKVPQGCWIQGRWYGRGSYVTPTQWRNRELPTM